MNIVKRQMTKKQAGDLFNYSDGILTWKIKPSQATKIGDVAGAKRDKRGYAGVMYKYKTYQLHTLIWNIHYGLIPEGLTVDHIDRDPKNNSIENLRLASSDEQNKNRSKILFHRVTNAEIPIVGVRKHRRRYVAYIRNKSLGSYYDLWDAICARKSEEWRVFSESMDLVNKYARD